MNQSPQNSLLDQNQEGQCQSINYPFTKQIVSMFTKQSDNYSNDCTFTIDPMHVSKDFSTYNQDDMIIGAERRNYIFNNQMDSIKVGLYGDSAVNTEVGIPSKNQLSKQNTLIHQSAKNISKQQSHISSISERNDKSNAEMLKITFRESDSQMLKFKNNLSDKNDKTTLQNILNQFMPSIQVQNNQSTVSKKMSWNQSFFIYKFMRNMKKQLNGRILQNLTLNKIKMIGDSCTTYITNISQYQRAQVTFNDTTIRYFHDFLNQFKVNSEIYFYQLQNIEQLFQIFLF